MISRDDDDTCSILLLACGQEEAMSRFTNGNNYFKRELI